MSGRGVKRKRSGFEEAEEEITAGNDEVQTGSGPDLPRLQQRQLVLRLCLDKLQCYQTGMEPRLHRSVLLVNTLRQLQEDMQRDGAGSVPLLSPHPGTLDNTPDLPDAPSGLPLDGASLCPFPLRGREREEVPLTCPGCAEAEKLGVHPPPPSRPASSSDSPPRESLSGCSRSQCPMAPLRSVDAANSHGHLSDFALDDIFEDIDTSMYESSELPSAWTVYPSWAVGLSSLGDEELKMFSGYTSASTLPSCLTDMNDLDHIMEILVNS